MSSDSPSIYDQFRGVREHPDFVFGTIFVRGDFPGGVVPETFHRREASEALAQAGNEYIEIMVGPPVEADEDASDLDGDESPS